MQFEVLVPRVLPGIEEPDRPAGLVSGCDIRPFVSIAEDTGVGQVADNRGAAVFPADNVIDLVRKAGTVLMHQAVFATSTGPLDDETARGVGYLTSH